MITVFTSCYNQGEFLSEAIESVLNQTYKDFEYILMDDGSTDNTWFIMEKYKKIDNRIHISKLSKQSNVGVLINKSIDLMKGDFWVWLPADDVFKKDLLEIKFKKSLECNHSVVIYSWFEQIDKNGDFIRQYTPNITPEEFSKIIWNSCPIGFTGIWVSKNIFERVGKFPEDLPCSEDYSWLLRAVANNVLFVCENKVLYQKRIHPNRTTNREGGKVNSIVKEIRKEMLIYKDKINV